jgi:hypothetical protein
MWHDDDLPGVSHRYLDAGGLRMHAAEAGTGPLVVTVPAPFVAGERDLVLLGVRETPLHGTDRP